MSEQSPAASTVSRGGEDNSGYDRALKLMQYHAQLSWLVFGAFLLAETVLLGAIGSMMKDVPGPWLFGGAVLGFVLAVPWWASSWHNYKNYRLRIEQAREFEPAAGNFLTEGEDLAKGGEIRGVRMPFLARVLPPRRGVPFLVVAFALAFLAIAIVHNPWKLFADAPCSGGGPNSTLNTSVR